MEQKIEGVLTLNFTIGGEKSIIYADKVVYENKLLSFFSQEKEILTVKSRKEFRTIYEALNFLGIKAEGY